MTLVLSEEARGVCGRIGRGADARVTAMATAMGRLPVSIDAALGSVRAQPAAPVGSTNAAGGPQQLSWAPGPLPRDFHGSPRDLAASHDALTAITDGRIAWLQSGVSGAVPVYVDTRGEQTSAGDDAGRVPSASAAHFCSRLEPLVRSSVGGRFEADWSAWAEILAMGGPLDGRTTFAGVRRLRPFESVSVQSDSAPQLVQEPWPWLEAVPESGAGVDRLRDALVSRIDAISESGDIASLLSGGWDARVLAAYARRATAKAQRSLSAFTTSKDTGTVTEELVAAQVATHLNVPHHIVETRLDQFIEDFEDLSRSVDFQTSFHPWLVPLARTVADLPVTALDGLGGGLFVGGAFPDREDVRRRGLLAHRFTRLARYLEAANDVLHPRATDQIRDRARADFERVSEPLLDHPHGSTWTAYLTRSLPGISHAAYSVIGAQTSVATPYLGDAVVRSALAIAPDDHADARLYRALLLPISPELAAHHTASDLSPRDRRHPRRMASLEAAMHFKELLSRDTIRPLVAPSLLKAPEEVWQRHLGRTQSQHLIRGLAVLALWLEEYADVLAGDGVEALRGSR